MSYVLEVANSISSQSGYRAVLGPELYTLIAEWEKREIPLPVITHSINAVCDENGELASIGRFQDVVMDNFHFWLQMRERDV